MDIETFRNYCLSKKGVSEEFPFDNGTLVFKLVGKIFALCPVEPFCSINLKCDPEEAIQLREKYSFISPGFHMNKKHWNTIDLSQLRNDMLLKLWIDHSYELVKAKLTRSQRDVLERG